MTPEQIEQWKREARSRATTGSEFNLDVYESELARLVRADALEEAAKVCHRFADRDMHPRECAGAIEALKEPTRAFHRGATTRSSAKSLAPPNVTCGSAQTCAQLKTTPA